MIDCFDIYDRLLLCVQERLECAAVQWYSFIRERQEGQEKAKPIPGRVQINPVAVMIKSRGWVDVIQEEIQYLFRGGQTNRFLPLILLRSSMSSSMSHLKLSSAAVIDQPNR